MEKKNRKIERDPYYSELYDKYGFDYIEDAGYFNDSISQREDIKDFPFKLTIPVNTITENIKDSKNPCVIITTGSFCPIHDGHIEMMKLARKSLEENGFDVLAGYIAPDHDDYIISKNGDEAILAHERIKLINDKCKDIDWLNSDPTSSLFAKGSINFTEVVENLDQYLKSNFDKNIKVFYVCGGDNSRFAKTFKLKGNCVVVRRPSYEKSYDLIKKELEGCENIIWTISENSLSSTAYRSVIKYERSKKQNLSIRIEENDDRENMLLNVIINSYDNIQFTKTSDQKETYVKLSKGNNLVSLDSIFKNESASLEISRHYDLFGCNLIRYGNRPGSDNLKKQASDIKKGNYVLVDDDIHTGGTMRFAKNIMESCGHKIDSVMALMMSIKGEEILDARDFFIGGENNGLVIQLPNKKITRAPYVYPYVCPFSRASIQDPINFSIEIWKMNLDYFAFKNSKLKEHTGMIELFLEVGFTLETDMTIICNYHIDMLTSLL